MGAGEKSVAARLLAGRAVGKHVPAIAGTETDEELRRIALQLAEKCPLDEKHAHCPFRTLGGLTLNSLRTFLEGMERHSLLALFEMELACRTHPAASCQRCDSPPPAG
jgi:hypothetical protein